MVIYQLTTSDFRFVKDLVEQLKATVDIYIKVAYVNRVVTEPEVTLSKT